MERMMICNDLKAVWVEFLDGRLPPDRAGAVRDHLAACAACREEGRRFERSWDLLGQAGTLEPPGDFLQSVRRRIRRSRILGFAGAVTAAAAAVLIAVVSLRPTSAEPQGDIEKVLSRLPAEDRRLLEDLARDDAWELAENIELVRAYELLDRDGNGFLPGEDH